MAGRELQVGVGQRRGDQGLGPGQLEPDLRGGVQLAAEADQATGEAGRLVPESGRTRQLNPPDAPTEASTTTRKTM